MTVLFVEYGQLGYVSASLRDHDEVISVVNVFFSRNDVLHVTFV